jgi:hypothetical protein
MPKIHLKRGKRCFALESGGKPPHSYMGATSSIERKMPYFENRDP